MVGQGRPDRAREGRRPHRRGEGGLDRAAGRLDDGARRRRRVRRQDDQRRLALARPSARSSSSASPTCAGRSRSATSTCWRCSRSRSRSASSTRARSSGARRSPIRRSSTCSDGASGSRGATGRRARPRPSGRCGCSPAACVFLAGFRVGLNVEAQRSVIDVGFAGVVGAQRIANGEMPYGHMPVQESQKPCGTADAEGEIRERIQTNGRCEASNPRGDTYGPVSYLAYLPGLRRLRLDREVGRALGRACDLAPLRRALHPRPRARRAGASAARGSPRRSRSPGRRTRSRSTPRTRTRTTRSCPRS